MTNIDTRPNPNSIFLPLQDLQSKPEARMRRDMAVHEPWTRIVRFEGDDYVASGGQEDDISAGRIVVFQSQTGRECGVVVLLEDGEVMAVEVDLGWACQLCSCSERKMVIPDVRPAATSFPHVRSACL